MKFSERIGAVKPRTALQIASVDLPLRTGLWNALLLVYFKRASWDQFNSFTRMDDDLHELVDALWLQHFKRPMDTLSRDWEQTIRVIRDFFFEASWFEVYDFIEFCPSNFPDSGRTNAIFRGACNATMEQEKAGYRFVADEIVAITTPTEIEAIEQAQALRGKFAVVSEHLSTALGMLSDRKKPDYRNSIKESISAVESMCSILAGQQKADLGMALKALERRKPLHGALKSAFGSLYGFTSDADGIRHALLEESNLTFADAKFMLVACSAFVNYLKEFIEE